MTKVLKTIKKEKKVGKEKKNADVLKKPGNPYMLFVSEMWPEMVETLKKLSSLLPWSSQKMVIGKKPVPPREPTHISNDSPPSKTIWITVMLWKQCLLHLK